MSSIDDRIVSIIFDNSNFGKKIEETIASLDKLTESIKLSGAQKGFGDISDAADRLDFSSISDGIDNISNKFSALGAIGFAAIQKITSGVIDFVKNTTGDILEPIITGGKNRALNIEQAKFMFRGLGINVEQGMKSALDAVLGTAFGLDEAAKAAAQFGASGIAVGADMTAALRGVAGAAALTGKSFTEIADIFAGSAGSGKVTNQDLFQFATRGLNAAAAVAKVMGKTEAQVHEMATKGDLDFKTFAAAMNKAFGEHATKANEIYAGSLANMRAALSRLGASFFTPDLEQQRNLFNALTPVIDNVHAALKPLIAAFIEIRGVGVNSLINLVKGLDLSNFKLAIPNFADGLKNSFAAFQQFANLIKDAFREIFPPSTTSLLLSLSEAFKNFTEKLKMGGETADSVKNIFKGIFSAIAIGIEIVKVVTKIFSGFFISIADNLDLGEGRILKFFGNLGKTLSILKLALVDGGGIKDFFDKLVIDISGPIKTIVIFIRQLKDNLANIFDFGTNIAGSDEVSNVLGRVESRFNTVTTLAERFGAFWDGLLKVLDFVWTNISTWFSELGQKMADAMGPGDFKAILDVANIGLLGGIALLLKNFLDGGFLNLGTGISSKIASIFGSLTTTLKSMQAEIKAGTLLKIAIAIGVLTASILVLSLIDSAALTKALVAMSVGFGELIGVLALLDKVGGGVGSSVKIGILAASMILLASAMVVLSIAIKILSTMSWNELTKGFSGIAVGLGLLVAAMHLLPPSPGMISAGLGIIAISTGLLILSKAVELFSHLSWSEMGKGLVGIAGGLLVIAATMSLMPPGILLIGIGITALSVALLILAQAIQAFANISWTDMGKGLIGIGGALIVIAGAMWLMPPGMILMSTGLLVLSVALVIMAKAIQSMGDLKIEVLAKGLGALAIMLGILAAAMVVMTGTLAGAAALLVVSAALLILSHVLEILGNMSIREIVTGLGALAGVFILLGLAALILSPVIPTILGLGIAIGLVGGAFALFGAGAYLVAIAFETMARAGKAGMSALIESIKLFITAMPEFIGAFVSSLIELATELLRAAPVLLKLITVLLIQILDTVIELTPKIAEALSVFIDQAIILIRAKFPKLVTLGFEILITILKGIKDNISEITILAIEVVSNFADTMSNNAQKFVDSAILLLFSFLDAIANRAGDIVLAGVNLLLAFLQGISDNILKVIDIGGEIIVKFITGVTNKATDILQAGANSLIKFLQGISDNIPKISKAATDVAIAFINAMGENALRFANAAADALIAFINGLAEAIRTKSKELREAGANIASAIIDGMTGGLASKAKDVADKAVDLAKGAVDKVGSFLGINSPSKVFIGIGKSMAEGMSLALDRDSTAKNSAVRHAERIVKAFEASLTSVPGSILGMDEFNPVITPVLDLTKVQLASKNIDRLMSVSAISPDVSFGQARLISSTQDMESSSQATPNNIPPSEVKFEQNIFAPTALSTNDIYRNTKSQIVLAKEELGIS